MLGSHLQPRPSIRAEVQFNPRFNSTVSFVSGVRFISIISVPTLDARTPPRSPS
jgi:hypothetical protein